MIRSKATLLVSTSALLWLAAPVSLAAAPRDTLRVNASIVYESTLRTLCDALLSLQVRDTVDANYGAIYDPACKVYHTRAAEAVYPLAVLWKRTGEVRYLRAGTALVDWLIRQQNEDGSWYETPETWTGTTADQLLMLALAYPIVQDSLTQAQTKAWRAAIKRAADYLAVHMSQRFAHINYCATTTASLAAANTVVPKRRYRDKAKELATLILAKFNHEGFLTGEGKKERGVQYGVDLGYNVDMSLWGLALYARLLGDDRVFPAVRKALRTHLLFVYPNGAIDNSWGVRSNKWTLYGSGTADGCQPLFGIFAAEDPRYRTAGLRNLYFLRTCMNSNGFVGRGPQHWLLDSAATCIYPTFARAKGVALALEFGELDGSVAPLPSDQNPWFHLFRSVDVALVRTRDLMATITAYRYKHAGPPARSKYMNRPTGGSLSLLWVRGFGLVQASSQSRYRRWEPMHFPKIETHLLPLTPRIEFRDSTTWYTNLYEFDAGLETQEGSGNCVAEVTAWGELRDSTLTRGGVAYTWKHRFYPDALEKEVHLRFHGPLTKVHVVEPLVWHPDCKLEVDAKEARLVLRDGRTVRLVLEEGRAKFRAGKHPEAYVWPYPALRCVPVELVVEPPEEPGTVVVRYALFFSRPGGGKSQSKKSRAVE